MTVLLQLKDIVKDYFLGMNTINVLKGINLEIKQGDFVSIMGHSGSGKSTLMNIIGLLDSPTQGEYFFEGNNVANLNDDQHAKIRGERIGFVFQTYNLIPRKSALEQVMLPLAYQGVPKAERIERAQKALEKIGLGHRMNNKPNELSGGEQQRVSIARALVINPSIILADEPTGALDTKRGEEIMELISQVHKEGKTIVLITHERDIASYAKTHLFLKDGEFIDKI
ncbi:MAG: ABC transporter ATP-binding protein [Candidatus Absconditicoccaceae bacterium]